jgi:hypothetical protein
LALALSECQCCVIGCHFVHPGPGLTLRRVRNHPGTAEERPARRSA